MNTFSKLSLALESIIFSQKIEFSETEISIFVNTKEWGLTGDHYYIFFSDTEKRNPDETRDLIFYELRIFFKVENDELFIWTMTNISRGENFIFNGIKTQIIYSSSEEMRELEAVYKEIGLIKVSIKEGVVY
jgi:hypothetical protein